MTEEQLLIGELAKRAGVSVRTIRYYISEGLLPAPPTKGRYTAYDEAYINRIRLIQHWKKSYLPLKEIRARLDTLSEQDIQAEVEKSDTGSPRQIVADSAEAYLMRVMHPNHPVHKQAQHPQKVLYQVDVDRSLRAEAIEPELSLMQPGKPDSDLHITRDESEGHTTGANWLHLSIVDGVELHIRQPISPTVQAKIDQLINFARRLLK